MLFNVSFLNINFSLAASLAWTHPPQTSHPPYAVDPVLIGQRNFYVKSTASAVRPAERWWLLRKIGKDITSLLSAYVVSQIKVDSQIWFLAQLFVQFLNYTFSDLTDYMALRTNERSMQKASKAQLVHYPCLYVSVHVEVSSSVQRDLIVHRNVSNATNSCMYHCAVFSCIFEFDLERFRIFNRK